MTAGALADDRVTEVAPPDGYVLVRAVRAVAVARRDAAAGIAQALAGGTLDAWAARHPERREMRGRGVVHAVPLPAGGPRVVVRHARHGGLLAPLTGDRFLAPTRAPHELDVALRLAALGVPTPAVVAYALYPAGPLLRRADVATAEVEGGLDLPAALARWPQARGEILAAVGTLLRRLARAGARHPDLNVKNVLITHPVAGDATAHVLDVDRVRFERPGDAAVADANVTRLLRSARKWAERGAPIADEAELAALAGAAAAGPTRDA